MTTHQFIYEAFQAINLAALCFLLGRQSGFRAGAYEGAKQAVRLLDERGLIAEEDEDEP